MNLLDEISYHLTLMYSPIFDLAEKEGTPLWAVLQTIKDGKCSPESALIDSMDSLVDAVLERVIALDGKTNIYFPLGLSMAKPKPYKSISKDTATMPHVFALDVDVAGDNHKSETLPKPEDVDGIILALEEKFGVPATAIASTGGEGRHLYWAFNRSLWDTEIDALKAVVYEIFAEAGFHVDKLSGKGQQLMRAIGSKNINQGDGVSHWLRAEEGRYDIEAVMAKIPKIASASSNGFKIAAASQRTTKPTDMKLVGNRLDKILDPVVLLSQFHALMEGRSGIVFVRPDGTWNDSENHLHYLAGSTKIAIWGDRLAAEAGLIKGYGYGSFSLITTLFCGGNAGTAARALGYLERQNTGGEKEWIASIINFFDAFRTPEEVAAKLPRPTYRGSRGGSGARYTKRGVAA